MFLGGIHHHRSPYRLKNIERESSGTQAKSFLNAFDRTLRLPPDFLETWWERVLALVAVGLVVAVLVDVVIRGL
jgi:hypothetical protein